MIAAKQAGLKLSFKNATKADFQCVGILKAIQEKLDNQQEIKIEFE